MLKHVTNSQELAKIDPDTGLQQDGGPSINREVGVSLQRTFSQGSIFISYAQADARTERPANACAANLCSKLKYQNDPVGRRRP
jgi:hypothetical protein